MHIIVAAAFYMLILFYQFDWRYRARLIASARDALGKRDIVHKDTASMEISIWKWVA